ncbi:HNH endonuclease signature motif containing protein [Demequina maris]|uniref:HNH endonuclease signature motif containing protein n=1 Tax=Demequina maris TaxID=1638982 RepID=UPI00078478DD|nr:HNH endonuclease signature motif containing protein [Demequina maris]
MDVTTAALDRAAARVRALDGAETRELRGEGLHAAIVAACEVLSEARRLAAPIAAAVARDAGGQGLRGGITRQAGHRSPEYFIATLLGGTVAEARTLIGAGLAMDPDEPEDPDDPDEGENGGEGSGSGGGGEDDPNPPDPNPKPARPKPRPPVPGSLAEALGNGTIAVDAAAPIRATLAELLDVVDRATLWEIEKRLVAKAARLSLYDLRTACWRERATADPAGWREREKRIRARRSLMLGEDAEGMVTLTARLDPLSAAPLRAWLDAQTTEAFRSARDAGVTEQRNAAQIRVDALAALASHGLDCAAPGSGVKTTLMVTIDRDALTSELGLGSCDGIGVPITGATARQLAVDAEILPAVCGGESEVLDLGRARRLFTRAQRRALSLRDGGCAWCSAPISWAETHHIAHWGRDGGCTDLCDGVLLCRSCHLRLHDTGWEVELHSGVVWFRPPTAVDPDRVAILGGRRRLAPEEMPAPPPLPTSPATRRCSGNHVRT